MSTSDILYNLLDKRKITLSLPRTSAESLRVSLSKSFKNYKEQAEKLGWLEDDVAVCVISLEYTPPDGDSEIGTATFFLRPRKKPPISYVILEDLQDQEPSDIEQPENDPN